MHPVSCFREKTHLEATKAIKQTDDFLQLPDELLLKIFALLSKCDLLRTQQTCRRFQQIGSDPKLWTAFYCQDFAPSGFSAMQRMQREYKLKYCIDRFLPFNLHYRAPNKRLRFGETTSHFPTIFSPDSSKLLTRCDEGWRDDVECYVWETATGKQLHTFNGKNCAKKSLDQVRFSPDNRYLTIQSEKTVQVWDLFNQKSSEIHTLIHTLPGYEFNSLTFSANGRMLAAIGEKIVKIFDTDKARWLQVLKREEAQGAIVFSENGKKFAARSGAWTVSIWCAEGEEDSLCFSKHRELNRLENREPKEEITDPKTGKSYPWLYRESIVEPLAFSPDGLQLVMRASSGRTVLWNLKTNENFIMDTDDQLIQDSNSLYWISCPVIAAFWSPEGSKFATTTLNARSVRIWNAKAAISIREVEVEDASSTVFSPDGNQLITRNKSMVSIFNIATGQQAKHSCQCYSKHPASPMFTPDGSRYVEARESKVSWVVDLATHKKTVFQGISNLIFSPDASYCAATARYRVSRLEYLGDYHYGSREYYYDEILLYDLHTS